MKTVVNFFETQTDTGKRRHGCFQGVVFAFQSIDLKAKKNLSYMNFVWQGDELLIDNSETFNQFGEHAKKRITFGINKHLSHQMKWILKNDDETYQLGPNLKMAIDGAEIPDPYKPGTYEDLQTSDGEAAFFLAKDEYYFFSIHTNWRFLNLNAASSNMIASPTRTLLVYSDVSSSSSVLGDQKWTY